MSFRPAIESITAEELSFCVGPVEWGRADEDGSPLVLQTPVGDGDDECYDLAPNDVSNAVWEEWGISPCTYDTLGLNIGTSIESLRYSDGHPDHDVHAGAVEGGLVRWELGQSGEPVRVESEDTLDIIVHLDVTRSDGSREFELEPAGLTGL